MFSVLDGSVDDYVSLGNFKGSYPSIDPYCVYLENLPRIVMWTTLFTPSYDFSKAIDKVKRILVVFGVVFVIASYILFSKLWSQEFDSLLRVCIAFNLVGQVLKL